MSPTVSTSVEPAFVDLRLVVDQMRVHAREAGDFDQAVRVGGVAGADDEQQLDLVQHLLHRPLAVRGRVTDVFALRSMDVRKSALQHVDDLGRLVDRKRGLRDVRDGHVSWKLERFGVGDALDEHRRVGSLAHRADDLFVTGMSDQDDAPSFCRVAPRLNVHLGHERAGRVDRRLPAHRRALVDRRGDPVSREHEDRSRRSFGLVLDEDRAAPFEVADDVCVVHDLLADVDGRTVER